MLKWTESVGPIGDYGWFLRLLYSSTHQYTHTIWYQLNKCMCDLLLYSGFFAYILRPFNSILMQFLLYNFIRTYACIFIQFGIDCFNINSNIAKKPTFQPEICWNWAVRTNRSVFWKPEKRQNEEMMRINETHLEMLWLVQCKKLTWHRSMLQTIVGLLWSIWSFYWDA